MSVETVNEILGPTVAVDDLSRVEALIAHETCNATIGLLQRCDLADGTYISSVNSRVREWIRGWQTQ